jgi:hypothetical protein
VRIACHAQAPVEREALAPIEAVDPAEIRVQQLELRTILRTSAAPPGASSLHPAGANHPSRGSPRSSRSFVSRVIDGSG